MKTAVTGTVSSTLRESDVGCQQRILRSVERKRLTATETYRFHPLSKGRPKPPGAVGWFEIAVTDLDRLKAFRETVFDITLDDFDSPHAGR